jgi:hypothetical protein
MVIFDNLEHRRIFRITIDLWEPGNQGLQLADAAFYNFEKMTGYHEQWLLGLVCWIRMAKGNNGVYFHFRTALPSAAFIDVRARAFL